MQRGGHYPQALSGSDPRREHSNGGTLPLSALCPGSAELNENILRVFIEGPVWSLSRTKEGGAVERGAVLIMTLND